MDDNNKLTESDFQDALATEFGLVPDSATPPAADDTPPTPPAPAPADDDAGATPPAAEEQVPPAGDTPPAGEPANPQGDATPPAAGEEEQPPAAGEAEQPKPLTPDDIKAAIREANQETAQRVDQVHSAREEIISKIYPGGIDRNIYDSDGKVIKTAQDIVDRGLINERTNEAYTYEEAASFVLEANRKMTENINELNQWAENVAEQNISLVESNKRVMDQWGETLKAMPDVAKELAETYITTQLEFDKTGSYITRMGMSPEQFYSTVLAPYKQMGATMAQQQAAEQAAAQQQAAQAAAAQQQERNGLPPQRGTAETKANTGDPMLDALVDELNKG